VKEGLRNVAAGANSIALKRGIDKATAFLVGKIKDHAKPIEDSKAIAQVGTISAGNDEEVGALEKERERAPRDVAGMLRALEFDEHRHQLLCEVMFLC
jgi:hypothetical protein